MAKIWRLRHLISHRDSIDSEIFPADNSLEINLLFACTSWIEDRLMIFAYRDKGKSIKDHRRVIKDKQIAVNCSDFTG